jgi:hypothetical protein
MRMNIIEGQDYILLTSTVAKALFAAYGGELQYPRSIKNFGTTNSPVFKASLFPVRVESYLIDHDQIEISANELHYKLRYFPSPQLTLKATAEDLIKLFRPTVEYRDRYRVWMKNEINNNNNNDVTAVLSTVPRTSKGHRLLSEDILLSLGCIDGWRLATKNELKTGIFDIRGNHHSHVTLLFEISSNISNPIKLSDWPRCKKLFHWQTSLQEGDYLQIVEDDSKRLANELAQIQSIDSQGNLFIQLLEENHHHPHIVFMKILSSEISYRTQLLSPEDTHFIFQSAAATNNNSNNNNHNHNNNPSDITRKSFSSSSSSSSSLSIGLFNSKLDILTEKNSIVASIFTNSSSCPLCRERYTTTVTHTPHILPCGHTFCLTCLKKLYKTTHHTIECSLCRVIHRHIDNVESIIKNFAVIMDESINNDSCMGDSSMSGNHRTRKRSYEEFLVKRKDFLIPITTSTTSSLVQPSTFVNSNNNNNNNSFVSVSSATCAELMMNTNPTNQPPFCDVCEEAHMGEYYCQECEEYMCEISSKIHSKSKSTRSHEIIQIYDKNNNNNNNNSSLTSATNNIATTVTAKEVIKCPKHGLPLDFFDEECLHLLCMQCCLREHKGN